MHTLFTLGRRLAALGFAAAALLPAATLTVNTTSDTLAGVGTASVAAYNAGATRSLRGAIIAVNNDVGGPHTISLPAGTYTLTIANATATTEEELSATGDLDLKKAATIAGAGSGTTIIQAGTTNANGIDKILSINPGGVGAGFATAISDVTLRFGRNQIVAFVAASRFGGALDFDAGPAFNGSLTLTNVVFDQNSTTNGDGGAVALFGGGTVNATGCAFLSNTARSNAANSALGGAIYVANATTMTYTLTNCAITSNRTVPFNSAAAGSGGGIYSSSDAAGVQLVLHGCVVASNQVGFGLAGTAYDGGGIAAGRLTLDASSLVQGNTATRWGGGVYVIGGTSSISNSTLLNNATGSAVSARGPVAGGGAVLVNSGTTTISNCRIVGNTATGGSPASLDRNLAAAVLNGANNWHGVNAPVLATFGAGVTYLPNLMLEAAASPATVIFGQTTSTVTAGITRNSSAASGFTVPNGVPITFAGTLGTVSLGSSTLVSGTRAVTFTPGSTGGAGGVTATVDGQSVTAAIAVNVPPAITSANTTTFRVGAAGSFNVTATGTPAPGISFTGSLPSGVTLSSGGLLSGTPAAGTGNASYPITITANNTVPPNATQAFTLVVLSPWQYWQQQNFGANATNPAIAGDTADPDGDGLENLEEYGLGLDPNAVSLTPIVIDTTSGYLRLTTPKVASASDLTYTVEVSGDLATWSNAGTTVLINTAAQLQVRDNILVSGAVKRFIRLKITRS